MFFRTAKLIISVLIIAVFTVTLANAQLERHSTIKIDNAIHDFGSVSQGSVVKHSFSLKNTGNSTLRINRIIPGCGCTAGKLTPEEIAPGQSGVLELEFDSSNFSGAQTKTITLLTNDPFNERMTLTLKGNVNAELSIEPRQVVLSKVIKTEERLINNRQVVSITLNPSSSQQLGAIKSMSDKLLLKDINSSVKNKTFEVALSNDVPLGELRSSISVTLLNSAGQKKSALNIPIFATVSGPVKLSQNVLSFGLVPLVSEVQRRSVKLENHDEQQKLNIEQLNINHPALQVSSATIESGKTHVIHVDLDPSKLTKDLKSVLQIQTNIEQSPLILNILAVVPPKV